MFGATVSAYKYVTRLSHLRIALQERRYDASRGMSLLIEDWVSRASALQRKGRAGSHHISVANICTHAWIGGLGTYLQPVAEDHKLPGKLHMQEIAVAIS